MNPWHTLLIAVAVVALAEGVLITGMLRQIGGIYMQVGTPRPGETTGQGPNEGDVVDPEILTFSRPSVLVFLSPTCSFCPPVAKAVTIAAGRFRELDFIPAVIGADPAAKLEYAASLGQNSRTDLDRLFEEWSVAGTPFAVALDSDGVVRSAGIVNSLPQVEAMADSLLAAVVARPQQDPAHLAPTIQGAL